MSLLNKLLSNQFEDVVLIEVFDRTLAESSKDFRKIYIVRHGEPNFVEISPEHSNLINTAELGLSPKELASLTIKGHHQSGEVGSSLAKNLLGDTKIISSPSLRTIATAKHIALALKIPHNSIVIEKGLGERGMGTFTGMPNSKIRNTVGNDFNTISWTPAGGESLIDTQSRATKAYNKIKNLFSNANLIMVSHGQVLRALLAHQLKDWDEKQTSIKDAEFRELSI